MGAPTPTNQNNPTSAQQGKGAGSPQQGYLASPPAQVQRPGGKGLGQGGSQMPPNKPEFFNNQEMLTPPTQIQVPSSVNSTSMADVMPNTAGQPKGKGGNVTYPGQGGQPQMGKPNTYSNTVGPWDNSSMKPQTQSGKGKGY
jgi:hypothetical protein